MLWFLTSCNSHYKALDSLKEEYSLTDIKILPDLNEIRSAMGNDKIAFMAPYTPEKNIKSLFVIKELDNKHGILTEQEKKHNVSEEKAIYERLGLEAKIPKITFAEIGGAARLKEWAQEVKAVHDRGGHVKGAFLIGPTGSGKTRFVEAFAGHFKRMLVMLNLPLIMEMDNPIERLWAVFAYLEKQTKAGGKFVLLADEFEKMVDVNSGSPIQKQFLGQMLTILNDLNGPTGFKIDVVIFATANNLSIIMDNNPELLRHGRWSAKFFLNYPSKQDAIGIYKMYASVYNLKQFQNDEELMRLYSRVDTVYKNDNKQALLSVYSPAEINALMERLETRALAADEGILSAELIEDTIKLMIPIQKTASAGVGRQIKDAELGFEEC